MIIESHNAETGALKIYSKYTGRTVYHGDGFIGKEGIQRASEIYNAIRNAEEEAKIGTLQDIQKWISDDMEDKA